MGGLNGGLEVNAMGIRRPAISFVVISAIAISAWLSSENFRTVAYIPTKGDVPTIAAGATQYENGEPVKLGDKITVERATSLLKFDYNKFSNGVKKLLGSTPIYQHELDALVHLSKNIGIGAFAKSTALRKFKALDYEGGCDAILLFKRYKNIKDCSQPNRICAGLWTDRVNTWKWCKGEPNKYFAGVK